MSKTKIEKEKKNTKNVCGQATDEDAHIHKGGSHILLDYYSNNDYLLKCKQEASFELSKFILSSKAEGYETKANVLRISNFKFPDFPWPFVHV